MLHRSRKKKHGQTVDGRNPPPVRWSMVYPLIYSPSFQCFTVANSYQLTCGGFLKHRCPGFSMKQTIYFGEYLHFRTCFGSIPRASCCRFPSQTLKAAFFGDLRYFEELLGRPWQRTERMTKVWMCPKRNGLRYPKNGGFYHES